MSDLMICKHCGKSFLLLPGKPGLSNECAPCLNELTREAARPQKSNLEVYFAAPGRIKAEVGELAERFRCEMRKTLRKLKCPEEMAEGILDGYEYGPSWPNKEAKGNHEP